MSTDSETEGLLILEVLPLLFGFAFLLFVLLYTLITFVEKG